MPWSGSNFSRTNGTFTGAAVWAQDAGAGTKIVTGNHDTHDQDIATGIDSCINKNGANAAAADLPMGGFRHTNVANGTARAHYATIAQLQDAGVISGGTSTGSSNAYAITLTPAITALADGMIVAFVSNFANTGAATLNVNSLGAVALRYSNDAALVSGAIPSGSVVFARYATSSNTWRMIGATAGVAAITGSILNGSATLTLPGTTDTLVGRATTDTLTNKTMTSPVITGGSINNTPIGGTTASTGAFTTLSTTGAATLGSAVFTGTTVPANGAYLPAANTIGISTNGAKKFQINSAGDAEFSGNASGLRYLDSVNTDSTATSGPIFRLISADVAGSGSISFDLIKRKNGEATISNNETNAAAYIRLNIGGTERARIDSSGNFYVGGTSITTANKPAYSLTNAKAWVNFDGTLSGTITPRASFNVASVTKSGTGDYTINFTSALADANYCAVGAARRAGDTNIGFTFPVSGTYSTTACQIRTQTPTTFGASDANIINVVILGN